jgi:DNA-directed RNA polymerase specialized sigma24 family protein
MITAIKGIELNTDSQRLVLELYEKYSVKLQRYARKNYSISEDDALSLVYKTIYKFAEVRDRYSFEHEQQRSAFIFRTYINFLRNHFRDDRSFEKRNLEVELQDFESPREESLANLDPRLKMLQTLLDAMEDWERILLLMRGQGIPYSQIASFVNRPEKQLKVYYGRLKNKLLRDMNENLKK